MTSRLSAPAYDRLITGCHYTYVSHNLNRQDESSEQLRLSGNAHLVTPRACAVKGALEGRRALQMMSEHSSSSSLNPMR